MGLHQLLRLHLIPFRILPIPLLLALAIRSLILLFPQTKFQPDEFWQSLEPAHRYVFGYGHLTWEWRDLPDGGRLRGWLWPSVFVLVYKFLQRTGLDNTFLLTLLPRVVGVVVAAMTDWATYRLSTKLMGPGSSAGAFFLSITNTFHAYALPRTLSNSPETMLTTLALSFFPFESPNPTTPDPLAVQTPGRSDSPKDPKTVSPGGTGSPKQEPQKLDYVAMDLAGPQITDEQEQKSSLTAAVFFGSIAICIRPTTLSLWAYLGLEWMVRTARTRSVSFLMKELTKAGLTGLSVLACSTYLDYHMTGKLYFPMWSFVTFNLGQSGFFGATSPLYHLVQSLPILLFPIWYWWGQGFIACLLPSRYIPRSLLPLQRPEGMRSLARGLTFAIFTLSFSPHSEWRFLHPLLPSLLLFALPPLFHGYTPTIIGAYRLTDALRQYTRIPKKVYYFLLVLPIVICSYFCVWHDWANVEVMNVLRRGDVGNVTGLGVAMDCHATPWMSHLHRDIPNWFLTCEPPVGQDPDSQIVKSERKPFFDTPLPQFRQRMSQFAKERDSSDNQWPSHVITTGAILDMGEDRHSVDGPTIKDALGEMGYKEVWLGWQPFDPISRDEADRGGICIWTNVPDVPSL